MRVFLFAGLAEIAGQRELTLGEEDPPRTVGELEARLREQWPALAARPFRVAVNQRYAAAGDALGADDELALIPPVSGG
ncbi:MAG: MoaD/ThiS family protein [Planctomycetota bacterium]|jgi:molybdopterin converting factor subunit 1